MALGGLVIVGVMEIIVPLIMATTLTFDTIPVLVMVLDPVMSIIGMKNFLKAFFALTLAVLQPGGGYATSRVPTRTLVMVEALTSPTDC
jgi:hypothetical protein